MHKTHEEAWTDTLISSNRQRAKHIGLILERSGINIAVTSSREYTDRKMEKDKYFRLVYPEKLKEFLKAEKLRIKN